MAEDDSLKQVRGKSTGSDDPEKYPGARPKRRKGFYRAVKRGENWAVEIHKLPPGFSKMLAMNWYRVDWKEELQKRTSFLEGFAKDGGWKGGFLAIPLKVG